MTDARPTGRWRGVVALSLFAGAVGLLAQRPSLLLLASLGVGYAVYPRLLPAPPDPTLGVERTVTDTDPADGEHVAVSLTVRNEGDRWLPDLRIVDGVPPLLPVVEGTPRRATALGPGEETTLEYAIEAKEGKHRFEATTVLARDLGGATERRTTLHEPTVVDCGVAVPTPAVRDLTRHRTGQRVTDDGGSGLEFHGMREYQAGDPMKRVDWRRLASGGELTTVEFREERAAAVVLCVDLGEQLATGGPVDSGASHAVARSVAAADRLAVALTAANHEVGLATLGPAVCGLPLGVGQAHLTRLRHLLDTHEAFGPATANGPSPPAEPGRDGREADGHTATASATAGGPTATVTDPAGGEPAVSDGGQAAAADGADRSRSLAELRERLDGTTQVALLSPLADDDVVDAVRRLEVAGHSVTVVSPDTTTEDTVGNRLVACERATRIQTLRRLGVPVVDWASGQHLGNALSRTMEQYQ